MDGHVALSFHLVWIGLIFLFLFLVHLYIHFPATLSHISFVVVVVHMVDGVHIQGKSAKDLVGGGPSPI